MGVTLTPNSGTALTLEFKELGVVDESENIVIARPNDVHYYAFIGNKGSTYQCSGMLHSVADYNAMRAWNAQNYLTASASTLSEFTNGTTWAIVKRELTRRGGWLNHWEYKLTLMQIFTGSATLADGSNL